jgi:hypothetical protein
MDKNSAPKLSYTLSATIYILKASRARDEPTLIYAIFNPIPISQSGRLPIADPANGDTAECVIYAAEEMLAVPSSAAFSTKQFTVSEVFRMMNDNNTVTREFGMVMNRYDVLLAPTCAVRVPPANGPYSLLAEEALGVWITVWSTPPATRFQRTKPACQRSASPRVSTAMVCQSACSSTAISPAKICCFASQCNWNKPGRSGSASARGCTLPPDRFGSWR